MVESADPLSSHRLLYRTSSIDSRRVHARQNMLLYSEHLRKIITCVGIA